MNCGEWRDLSLGERERWLRKTFGTDLSDVGFRRYVETAAREGWLWDYSPAFLLDTHRAEVMLGID